MLRSRVTRERLRPVKRAPPRQLLDVFGGPWDIGTFRTHVEELPRLRDVRLDTTCEILSDLMSVEADRVMIVRGSQAEEDWDETYTRSVPRASALEGLL